MMCILAFIQMNWARFVWRFMINVRNCTIVDLFIQFPLYFFFTFEIKRKKRDAFFCKPSCKFDNLFKAFEAAQSESEKERGKQH